MTTIDVYIATVRTFGARLEQADLPLSAPERGRAERFHHMSDKWEFVLGRVMARLLLSRRLGTAPADLQFVENDHGRPEITHPAVDPPLHFNLSHSGGLVACVMGGRGQIGVDLERLDRPPVDRRVIDRYCSAEEQTALFDMPETLRHERFLQLWTLKEAYVKARGTGLTLPLRKVSFHIGVEGPGDVSFNGIDDERRWMFAHTQLEPKHLLAVAAEREPDEQIELRLRPFTPDDAGLA